MLKLNAPGMLKSVSTRLLTDIDNYCVTTYDGGHRNHLGASLIGNECKRYLWFVFRWCLQEPTTGRKQRLFNRGHREEERFLEWLRGIGCEVSDVNGVLHYHLESDSYFIEDKFNAGGGLVSDVTNYEHHRLIAKERGIELKQHRIIDCNGHFGGSLDGKGYLPKHYEIDEKVLFEFKTNGTGAGFDKLGKVGMQLAKDVHFAQTSVYGFKESLKYCVYCNINKNDDSLHLEVVELNHRLGEHMILKAEQIIFSQNAPPRLSDNPTFYKCGYCAMKGICHNNESIERNCRSCTYCIPMQNAEWHCAKFGQNVPKDYLKQGCPEWSKIY